MSEGPLSQHPATLLKTNGVEVERRVPTAGLVQRDIQAAWAHGAGRLPGSPLAGALAPGAHQRIRQPPVALSPRVRLSEYSRGLPCGEKGLPGFA
jgi:hypothetical protein